MESWWNRISTYWNGFSRDARQISLQIFVASSIFMAVISPYQVWNFLSFGILGPNLVLVVIVLVLPFSVGQATWNVILVSVGFGIGAGLGSAATYIAYAINGCSFDASTARGISFVITISIFAGCLNALRWKHDVTNKLFFVCCLALVLAGGVSAYPLNSSTGLLPLKVWALMCGAMIALLPIFWLLLPVTAGRKYKDLLSVSLANLADAVEICHKLLMSPIDPESGKFEDSTNHIDAVTGEDEGLKDIVEKATSSITTAKDVLLDSKILKFYSYFEIDIYHHPKIFPRSAFARIRIPIWHLTGAVSMILRPLQGGRLDLCRLRSKNLAPAFDLMLASISNVLSHMSQAIVSTSKLNFASVDESIEKMDNAWFNLLELIGHEIGKNPTKRGTFAIRLISSLLYVLGTRTRAIFVAMPSAVIYQDPKSALIVAKRLKICPGWLRAGDRLQSPSSSTEHLIKDFTQYLNSICIPNERFILNFEEVSFQNISNTRKTPESLLVRKSERPTGSALKSIRHIWHLPVWIVFGIQFGIAFCIATILVVVNGSRSKLLHDRVIDVPIVVAASWVPTMGQTNWYSVQRVVGVSVGALWSYLTLALSLAAGGGSWEDNVGKFLVASGMTSVWMASCTMCIQRYNKYSVLWIIAVLTVPIVALPTLRQSKLQWNAVAYRIINELIAVLILLIVSKVVLPISASDVARNNLADAIENLVKLIDLLPSQFASREQARLKKVSENEEDIPTEDNPGTKMDITLQEEAIYGCSSIVHMNHSIHGKIPAIYSPTLWTMKAIFSPLNEEPVVLAIKSENAMNNLTNATEALHREYHLNSRPHWIPISKFLTPVRMTQAIMHTLMFVIGMRLDHQPVGSWEIEGLAQEHIVQVLRAVGNALSKIAMELRKANSDNESSIENAIIALESTVCSHIKNVSQAMVYETKLGRDPLKRAVPMSSVMLLYAEIWMLFYVKRLEIALEEASLISKSRNSSHVDTGSTVPEDYLEQAWCHALSCQLTDEHLLHPKVKNRAL